MRVEEAVKDYLLDIEIRKYSPRTIQSYKLKLRQLSNFCKEVEVTDIEDLTLGTVKQFTQMMLQRGNKGTYINSCLRC